MLTQGYIKLCPLDIIEEYHYWIYLKNIIMNLEK